MTSDNIGFLQLSPEGVRELFSGMGRTAVYTGLGLAERPDHTPSVL